MIFPLIDRLKSRNIVKAGRYLGEKGYIRGKEGNISASHGYTIWITPHDADIGNLNEREIIRVTGMRVPEYVSSEFPMHRGIYRKRRDVKYIVHIHPPETVALFERVPSPELWEEVKIYVGSIEVVPPLKPGTEELWKAVIEKCESSNFIVLRKHGVVSMGPTINEAIHKIEIMEKMAEIQLDIL